MTSATAYWPSMGSPRASKYSASVRQCHSSPPRGLRNLSSAGTDMLRGSSPERPSKGDPRRRRRVSDRVEREAISTPMRPPSRTEMPPSGAVDVDKVTSAATGVATGTLNMARPTAHAASASRLDMVPLPGELDVRSRHIGDSQLFRPNRAQAQTDTESSVSQTRPRKKLLAFRKQSGVSVKIRVNVAV